MKKIILFALLLTSSFAFAGESIVTLNFKSVLLTSQESGAALVDLSGEIKKQAGTVKLAGQRIKSVEVQGQASFLGATLILLISNQAVDSQSVDAGSNAPTVLSSSFPRSPGTWTLGIRGQMSLSQIRITLEEEDAKAPLISLDPLVRNDVNTPGNSEAQTSDDNRGPSVVIVPTQGGQQTANQDLQIGESLIAISSSSGLIDYVTLVSDDGGSYTIEYDGQIIPRWTRNQLAKTTGCSGDLCVGNVMNRLGDTLTIVGILPGDKFVVQKSNQQFLVVNRSNIAAPSSQTPAKTPVRAPGPTTVGRYKVGQKAYWVYDSQRIYSTQIKAIRANGSVDLLLADGSSRTITRSDQVAVIYGCSANNFCVGDQIYTKSSDGLYYEARIVAIQSNDYVVLAIKSSAGLVGYWPTRSLER